MKTVIHIGLHKTASTYLQNKVFTKLQRDEVIYNPTDLFYFINAIFTLDIKEKRFIDKAKKIANQYRNNPSNQTLFLSSEGISQLSFLQNYSDNISVLAEIFPDAEIILFLREQSSWLESCYKESIKHHFYQDITTFLNFTAHTFKASNSRFNLDDMLNMDVYKADWYSLVTEVKQYYPSTTHIYFFEDFKSNNNHYIGKILKILGTRSIEHITEQHINIGWSKKSIGILIKYNKLLNKLGIHKSTYRNSFNTEKTKVLSNNFFWSPSKPATHIRLARMFIREPARLIKRISIYKLMKMIDLKAGKRPENLMPEHMANKIRSIHQASNNKLQQLLGDQTVPSNYFLSKSYNQENEVSYE